MLRRLAMVVVCLLSIGVCFALAWWQWQRYESSSGTWQNLGYVLQWPLFGLFPIFVFLRMRRLTRRPAAADKPPPPPSPAPRPSSPEADTDDELAAYNRYLAELHARDQEGSPPA